MLIVLALVAAGLLLVSRFYPTIEHVAVAGNEHFSREEVLARADVAPGDPLLWITKWRVARLADDPWVARLRVIRHWPDTVSITLWERQPVLTDGSTVWAIDGTRLPGVDAETMSDLTQLHGWGSPRLEEALMLLDLLAPYGPKVISYSPEGFDIELTDATLFTPSAQALQRHWAAWAGQLGNRAAVYPWGVSEKHD